MTTTRYRKIPLVNPHNVELLAVLKPLHRGVHTVFSIAEIAYANMMDAINVHRARPDFVLRMAVVDVVHFPVVIKALEISSFVRHMVVESVVALTDVTSLLSVARRFAPLMAVVDVVISKDVTNRRSRPHDFVLNTGAGKNVHTKVVTK